MTVKEITQKYKLEFLLYFLVVKGPHRRDSFLIQQLFEHIFLVGYQIRLPGFLLVDILGVGSRLFRSSPLLRIFLQFVQQQGLVKVVAAQIGVL